MNTKEDRYYLPWHGPHKWYWNRRLNVLGRFERTGNVLGISERSVNVLGISEQTVVVLGKISDQKVKDLGNIRA